MLLAIDIGNTTISAGIIEQEKILFQDRLSTNNSTESDIYNFLSHLIAEVNDIEGCIISSVVPNVFSNVKNSVIKLLGKTPITVEPHMKTGLIIKAYEPEKVGRDRIVVCAAAFAQYSAPLIIIDLGTATNIEVVGDGGIYMGGFIIPGMNTSMQALTAQTAQLPKIELEAPNALIGRNTKECMQSGIMHGTAAMLDGLIERIEAELGCKATVIATGGLAPIVIPLCKREIISEPNLLLKGLEFLYYLNSEKE